MNFYSLRTLLAEIEATINNRPLTYIYDDEKGVSCPLTPSHLINGRRITSKPSDRQFEIVSHKSLTRKVKYHKRSPEQFTNSWRKEYLTSLRETSLKEIIQAFWKLAKVTELVRGRDGVVRSATIQCLTTDRAKTTELQ